MKLKQSLSRKIFMVFDYVFLGLLSLSCLLPLINLFAISFSARSMVDANAVSFWPKGFNTAAYEYILSNKQYFQSFGITIGRVILGWAVNLALTVLVAYPLSKDDPRMFRCRKYYTWFFLVTMVFNGGLIPTYLVVSKMQMINSFWALILPDAVPMFCVLITMNFFRGLPKAIEEAALVDGASWFVTMFKIYLPLSKPSLATVSLFVIVNHWNAWFDGLIYMNLPEKYPLMTYLQSVVLKFDVTKITSEQLMMNPNLMEVTGRGIKGALILLCTVPILMIYPFLQKYFVSGVVMGSVKE
ncbi:MAG TPA: carbohydrate ABC transporter permease [Candidatus Eisenbergiella stercoravium]|nr:carbohydrate ABC transporter permease [Candidatus Eisenbergiella stercoravium]